MRSSTNSAAPSFPAILAEIGGAILGGLLAAVVFGYGIGLLLVGTPLGMELGMGLLSLQVFAGVIGFGAGGGLGAALAGRLLGQGGSWWLAVLLGAVTGVAVILVMRLLNVGGLFGILGVGAALTIAAAVLGYNLRRRD